MSDDTFDVGTADSEALTKATAKTRLDKSDNARRHAAADDKEPGLSKPWFLGPPSMAPSGYFLAENRVVLIRRLPRPDRCSIIPLTKAYVMLSLSWQTLSGPSGHPRTPSAAGKYQRVSFHGKTSDVPKF